MVSIAYLGKEYELQIVETKPSDAICIIECDMNVDFEAPVGYQGTVENFRYCGFCLSRQKLRIFSENPV
jgi:hypothetical protein